ncbi:MAG: hypothetical protein L0Z70_15060 [Chloroflexi bacterium]|nr:hypothetical protein [Chloroflexota bacterium]
MAKIVCSWCQTVNDAGAAACIACGAPIAQQRSMPAETPPARKAGLPPPPVRSELSTQDLKKAGEATEQAYNVALGAYAALWRTLGEALAIAVTGFILGFIGGASELAPVGLLAAALIGVVVGLTSKNFWFSALSAPFGALLGVVIWLPIWALGAPPQGMVFTAFLAAAILARLGGYPARQPRFWQVMRPFLGLLGGLLFGLLGLLLGLGVNWAAGAL